MDKAVDSIILFVRAGLILLFWAIGVISFFNGSSTGFVAAMWCFMADQVLKERTHRA